MKRRFIFGKFRRRIAFQLLFWFLVIEFPIQGILVYLSYQNSRTIIQEESIKNLSSIAERQSQRIQIFFQQSLRNTELLATFPDVKEAILYYQSLEDQDLHDPILDSLYEVDLKRHQEDFAFKDLWLLDLRGRVCFAAQEQDMVAENLRNEKWQSTAINQLFERAFTILQADFSDFSFQEGKEGDLLMATPIWGENKQLIGILMTKLKRQALNQVLNDYTGLGKTGESVMFTKYKEDAIFINDTRHAKEVAFTKLLSLQATDNQVIKDNLAGNTGSGIIKDYRDEEVFARWVYIPALRSGLMVKIDLEEAFTPIRSLRRILLILMLITLTLVIIAAFSVANIFSHPIQKLTEVTREVFKGNMDKRIAINSKNEIGDLAESFNRMLNQLKVSQGQLKHYADTLEGKVRERTEELQKNNEELNQINEELNITIELINQQKIQLKVYNQNFLDSVHYASQIQGSFLPSQEAIAKFFENHFVLSLPKDVISGDFHWFYQIDEDTALIAVGDCTGHGVPGALMSILGSNTLDMIVKQEGILEVDSILNRLHTGIKDTLRQEETNNRDGMDIALIKVYLKEKKLEFAGAKNPILLIQNQEMIYCKGDIFPIGGTQIQKEYLFNKKTLDVESGTSVYLYSDGFQDQFGGENVKKYLSRNFRDLLKNISQEPIEKQKEILYETFLSWKGEEEQMDDILILGIQLA